MNPALSSDSEDAIRKYGMKRPALYITISLILGIASSAIIRIPIFYPILFAAALTALAFIYSDRRIPSHIYLYLAVFFFGMAFYQNSNILPPDHIANFTTPAPRKVIAEGIIADDPVIARTFYNTEKTAFTLKIGAFKDNDRWRVSQGLVKVDMYGKRERPLRFGDRVILEGMLLRPPALKNPGLFDYGRYLEIKNIHSVLKVKELFMVKVTGRSLQDPLKTAAYFVRNKIRALFDRYFAPEYGGFLKAILIGDRAELDDELRKSFVKTGTVHILAISGLNLVMIAAIVFAILGIFRIPKRSSLIAVTLFVIVYSFVAGSSPPIVRATVISVIFAIGYLLNREADGLNSLAIAAFLILLWNPKELFDPSFQLSFISVASIIIFTPRIDALLGVSGKKGKTFLERMRIYICKGVSVSVAAWAGTWPVIVSYFNIVSPVSILANLLIIPILFVITSASFAFLFAASFSNFLGVILAQILSVLESGMFLINEFFAKMPFAYFRAGSPSAILSLVYYMLAFLLILPQRIEFNKISIRRNTLLMAVLLALNIFVWKEILYSGRESLRITFLDVGQGDSALLELPGGARILIDGGSGGVKGEFDSGEAVVAPYLWNRGIFAIDAVVVTHLHKDHLGGILYILKNFKVGCVIDNGAVIAGDSAYDNYVKIAKEKNVNRLTVGEGDVIGPFGKAEFFVINPEKSDNTKDSNDNSVALKFVYKDLSVLFCGDIKEKAIKRILKYNDFLKSYVLKVPHHGGNLGNENIIEKFFDKVSPRVSVISVGEANRFNMPHKKTIDSITYLNSSIYETKKYGAITISEGGNNFYIEPKTTRKN